MKAVRIRRAFLAVGNRRVHYRFAGSGPPLVLLHGSPGDSQMLENDIATASRRYSCFAFDTPGFGYSDALPRDELTVADLAFATAEAMAALGLPACRVYGTHTGAAIAAELGVSAMSQVSGLVLEGLPIFTQPEMDALFEGYFAPMIADPLGGHLFSTWMRFRDQFTWFPWCARSVTRLNAINRPGSQDIHQWVTMFFRSCKTYGPAYRAACYYGPRALEAAKALLLPTVYTASAEDMLYPHLDRLPPLKAGQRIARLKHEPHAKSEAIVSLLDSLPGISMTHKLERFALVGNDPAAQFLDTPQGQIYVRSFGDISRPALIILHDAPGSGIAHIGVARKLAANFRVLLPDLPGNGESSPPSPSAGSAVLQSSADAIIAVVDALGLTLFSLVAIGCGTAVAAVLSERGDPRLHSIVIQSPPAANEDHAQAIAPLLPVMPDGSHWLRAWLMLRENQIYRPWFDGRVSAQRRTQGNFEAQWLHDQTCALMASRGSYHLLPRAAYRINSQSIIENTGVSLHRAPEPEEMSQEARERSLADFIFQVSPFSGDAACPTLLSNSPSSSPRPRLPRRAASR